MAVLPSWSSCLDLTISTPAFTPSPSLPSSSEGGRGVGMMRDLDINQVPSGEEDYCMELDEDESNINILNVNVNVNGPPRKKLRLTKEQSRLLEESFRHNHTLNPKEKEVLAMQLKLKPRQIEVWFQNRRARSKLKQTEMECEYLKRWFGSLTEQNRRLQREVEELRAMKVGPGHGGEALQPASMLTMCPRCERVSTATLDKGPTRTTTTTNTNTNTNTTTTLSSKVPILHSRHPSAAC